VRKDSLAGVSAWLLALVVGYVLSIGPVFNLAERGRVSPEAFEATYKPFELVAGVPSVRDLLNYYLDWWEPTREVSHEGRGVHGD